MLSSDPFTKRMVGRMLDFFAVGTPWQRRLWNVSTGTALREIVEASEAVRDRALGQTSLDWFRESFKERVGQDPGIGDAAQLAVVRAALQTRLAAGGESQRLLRQVGDDVQRNYLTRWSTALSDQHHGQQPERVARAIASHLLDAGFSQNHLHRWLTFLRDHDRAAHDAVGIVGAAQQLSTRNPKAYRVLVLFETPFPTSITPPREFLNRSAVAHWLTSTGLHNLLANVEQRGGLLLRIQATDPEAAVEMAGEIVDALAARSAVGTRTSIRAHPNCVVANQADRRYPLRRRRRVDVRAIERQDRLTDDIYDIHTSPIDSALQLLSHLDASSPEVAVAGGWSAIESLLSAPGDDQGNVLAADRMAALVACAWPRAELTTLAWRRIEQVDDELSARLESLPTNEERAALIAQEIKAERWLKLEDPSDDAAERRIKRLLHAPAIALRDVEAHAGVAFRRFYRQRNLVLHGGQTGAVALRASLRTVAPLVGAGIDRIVHAHLTSDTHPLDLSVTARLEIARAGSRDATSVTSLLE
ncbi:hypothetical protein [Conexibacter woesei]|uniref:hypothetical protein n=1 Tax=Conexibacter woesei TaxID=191495 RepID=UPI00040C47DA|nr:hypothetical protein [Conexibacter woesei]